MELLLKRKVEGKDFTEGELFIDGKFFCFCVEDKVRAGVDKWLEKLKVYAKTAIPYGRYQVLVTFSNRFQRLLPLICNVPNFEGIRIHNGTSELSSAGCPIISYGKDGTGRLVNDRKAMNDLTDLISFAQKKEKVYITII